MKNSHRHLLLLVLALGAFAACQKEQPAAPASLAAKFTDLTLDDLSDLPNPAATEQLAAKLFDLKEDGGGLTEEELRSLGDPARNEDLLYALLFVEKYKRDEILWSWQEKTPEDLQAEEATAAAGDRTEFKKWTWTGGASLAYMYCSGFKKWPAYRLKNEVTDPCGDYTVAGPVYQCCYQLCEGNRPLPCQSGCQPAITIPAGSVNALAAAIAQVCVNGTVTLAAGMHTENAAVTITKNVTIQGENGAVLKVKSSQQSAYPILLDPALHVKNTWGVELKSFELQPFDATGGTAILLESGGDAQVVNLSISGHQMGIMVEKSKRAVLKGNTIINSGTWQTGAVPEGYGIVNINGEGATIDDNDVSNSLFGIWACDKHGTYTHNFTHGNFIGLILCNATPGNFEVPGGADAISASPGAYWDLHDNKSTGNSNAGYLVIDGANHNNLKDNEGGSNGTYDIELAGDSYRFGVFTPFSSWNQVRAGAFPNVTIKDCGVNNTVVGGVTIDTGADPCF